MGISKAFKERLAGFSASDRDRLVRLGWEDRSTFDDIESQFGLTQNEFIRFMRTELSENDYERWRRRANEQGQLKHEKKRGFKTTRFKCSRQLANGITKGWK